MEEAAIYGEEKGKRWKEEGGTRRRPLAQTTVRRSPSWRRQGKTGQQRGSMAGRRRQRVNVDREGNLVVGFPRVNVVLSGTRSL